MAVELKPDLVVLDIGLPDFSGIDVAARIRDHNENAEQAIQVMMLSVHLKESLVHQALNYGARGYVVKTASSAEIVNAIRHVCQGSYYLSPEVSANIIPELLKSHERAQVVNPYNALTKREQQVFRLLAEGHSNKEIAEFLEISPKTVERHRANLMSKLGLNSYRDLLRVAVEMGILEF